jgi:pseudaminic acid biosynthesis-associated methylase
MTSNTDFWAGSFGDDYTRRNQVEVKLREPFFRDFLQSLAGTKSVCELGANRGHNLAALSAIDPTLQLTGVEVNRTAYEELARISGVTAVCGSFLEYASCVPFDLVFTAGVLIHVAPEDLPAAYRKIASLSSKYVLLAEYFNPVPVEIEYRGHSGKLFKRDFGSEFLNAVKELHPRACGFLWKRLHPAWDNLTWWLFERD